MKTTGLIITSLGLIGLSLVLGIAKLTMYVDKMIGSYHPDWTKYLEMGTILPVIIVLVIGIVCLFIKQK
ncbi:MULTISPECIES: hypothetical protein [Brevibacillus]|uniref:Uncharacterized protein n=1 Tax=Brevibacillus laterosporus TaxID=1465 RepID=A0AAP8QBV1_BRELA|nr:MULTISPECIES: hypothetical protein [Brevibacillus]MBG9789338.1 hypothetical protein [Brevibacillus laterosporus]MCG7317169.1 hypothetical protein [Brevibacillus laterosporus]PPA93783.1 hypothetical protein C4A77_16660 [Brevibacillus laterosporus]RFB28745.1 hypothetical protein DZB91_21340 [Brevibacillus sp. VP]